MKRTLTQELEPLIGQVVQLAGWVHARRNMGKLVFIDLRDRSGLVQVVFNPDHAEAYPVAKQLRPEFVISLTGTVQPRGEKNAKPGLNGGLEVVAETASILNTSQTPPFEIDQSKPVSEEIRLEHRYLDLRRAEVRDRIILRHKLIRHIRNWLADRDFIEVETPQLTKSTPEGARDYIVPARQFPGQFYALPQSPQQYKQLLMVAGLERYYQIARCFRDEDTRGDRQPEFTQLDLEMSFTDEAEVMALNEELMIDLVNKACPEKRLQTVPFPKLTYSEAVKQFKTDRPDLRTDKKDPKLLSFVWITDFPFFEKKADGGWTFTHNPFSAPQAECLDDLMAGRNIENIRATQYDLVLNGWEIGGGSLRNHQPEALQAVFKILGDSEKQIQDNFGHMLKALSFGAPPHGGIAWGLDRLVMVLANQPNIREVIAFPKTKDGRDLTVGAPGPLEPEQLKDVHISLTK